MPFTFSHPAIVLPLTYLPRRWFSLTGLVIGSMIPDFEYFIRMKIQSNYSHTINGLFWFDLPLGLIVAFVFHNIARNNLFENLPFFLKSKLTSFNNFDWNTHFKRNWFVVIISILSGIASHLLWDSFTHNHGYFVETIPALSPKIEIGKWQVPIFKILQHSSSLIGGLVIVYSLRKLPTNNIEPRQFNLKYWAILTGSTLIIIVIRLLTGLDYTLYGNLLVTLISAGLISLILISLVINITGCNNLH